MTVQLPRIVILTGAGISAESGIQTFRAADGLWEEHRVEDVASPEGYAANPELVQQFYNERRRHLLNSDTTPNAAHTVEINLDESEVSSDFEETRLGLASEQVDQWVTELLATAPDR